MTEFFEVDTRKKIYQLIEQNPGLNLSTIAEMLQMNVPLVDYHTRYFEKHDLVTIVKDSGFKRYYVRGSIGVVEQKLFEVLRQEIPLKIVLFLLKNPYVKHHEMHPYFDISKSTLSYHLKKLVKNNIIRTQTLGDETAYVIVDEKQVLQFLLRYQPSRVLKRFNDTWAGFSIP